MKRAILTALAVLTLVASTAAQEIDVFVTDYMGKQEIGEEKPLGKETNDTATLFAAPGEYEPFSFALQPHDRTERVMIKAGALTGPGGAIPAGNVRVRFHRGLPRTAVPADGPRTVVGHARLEQGVVLGHRKGSRRREARNVQG